MSDIRWDEWPLISSRWWVDIEIFSVFLLANCFPAPKWFVHHLQCKWNKDSCNDNPISLSCMHSFCRFESSPKSVSQFLVWLCLAALMKISPINFSVRLMHYGVSRIMNRINKKKWFVQMDRAIKTHPIQIYFVCKCDAHRHHSDLRMRARPRRCAGAGALLRERVVCFACINKNWWLHLLIQCVAISLSYR